MRCVLVVAFLVPTLASAQLLTNEGAAITVQSGAQLTVQGEVLNEAGGAIGNSGTIDLSGHWTNNSGNDCFGASEGTVILNGAGQEIRGSSYTQFNHLQLVGGDVTLMQDAYVGGGVVTTRTGVLALGNADLLLNSRVLGVTNADPTGITRTTGMLISETGPVPGYGRVEWFIGSHAPAVYTVPFGNATTSDYLPLDVNLLAGGVGSSGWFTFATYPTDPFALPNNRPLPTGLSSFTDLGGTENAQNVVDRFWIMDTEEYATEPTASFTFTYRDSEWNTGTNTIVEPSLQAQRWDGVWSNPPMGIVNPTANSVSTPAVNLFAQVWALVQGSTPLPVELLAFDAVPLGDEVRCTWVTASELNSDHFTVERSIDGVLFTDIGVMDAAGFSQQTLDYGFVDAAPLSGLSYYRLRQTDFDGTEAWSVVVSVRFEAPGDDLAIYPNPTTDELFIAGVLHGDERVTVIDAMGRTIADLGLLRYGRVDVSALATGGYSLQVISAAGARSTRFVKH